MAKINLYSYNHYKASGDLSSTEMYLREWIRFENLARNTEYEELNVACNKSWKKYSKKMWDKVDWKGKCEVEKKTEQINETTISDYFKKYILIREDEKQFYSDRCYRSSQ